MINPPTKKAFSTPQEQNPGSSPTDHQSTNRQWFGRGGAALVLILAIFFPFLVDNSRWQNLAILVLVYAMAAQGWNILGGYAGQISLGHALFFGIGAYATALTSEKFANTETRQAGVSPWVGLIVGVVIAMVIALIIGWPTFRLRGHYFSIATIAITQVVLGIFQSWSFVNGNTGIYQPILENSFFNFQFGDEKKPFYFIILTLLTLAMLLTWWLSRARAGYYFRAIKNNQEAAQSLGISATRYKLLAIVLSAAVTATAGGFYGQYITFTGPETVLALDVSVLITVVAILGGAGSLWGPVLGALLLLPLQDLTRDFFSKLGGGGKALDLVIYGALVTLIAIYEPNGLIAILRNNWQKLTRLTHANRPTPQAEKVES